MPIAALMQTSFNAGEWSPFMAGYIDSPKRGNAVKQAQNMIALKQGPMARRGGTRFVARVKDSTLITRVIGFEYSSAQAYMIEAGASYFRFFRNNGSVFAASQAITAITQGNPAVVSYAGADNFANGDEIYIDSVVGMTQLNTRRFKVAGVNAGANTFQLQDLDGVNVNSTAYTAYSSGGNIFEVYEVLTPYADNDIRKIRYVQSADVLFLVHPKYKPRSLVRSADNSWALNTLVLNDGPYLSPNATTTTLTTSGGTYTPGATVTLTASSVAGINGGDGFQTTDVGRVLRIKSGSDWAWGQISSRTSTLIVAVLVKGAINFPAAAATIDWRLGAWSDTTGYPACCTFFQDRIVFGGGPDLPIGKTVIGQRVDFSETEGYSATDLYFQPSNPTGGVVADDDAISITLNSRRIDNIRWLAGNERGLQVGTAGSEWTIRTSANSVTLTPSDVNAYIVGSNGSADIEPLLINWATLFPQRAKRKLLQLAYSYENDTYKAPDLTILAEHLTKTGFVELAYQQEPQNIVWGTLENGALLGCTYYPDEGIAGWHPHVLGGFSDVGATAAAKVNSIDVIPAADESRDELWCVAERYINGGKKQYVEYFTRFYESDIGQVNAVHVDSSLTYDGAPTTIITGLEHLEGQSVRLLVDGGGHPDVVVTGGAITLVRAGSVVTIGLANKWKLALLNIEGGSQNGVAQTKIKRIHKIGVRLYETLGLNYGPSFDKFDGEIFDYFTTLSLAPKLYTGDKIEDFPGDYETDGSACFQNDGPFPAQLQAVVYQLEIQDNM